MDVAGGDAVGMLVAAVEVADLLPRKHVAPHGDAPNSKGSQKNKKYNPIELDLDYLAQALTKLRLDNKLTQNDVAKKLNTSQAAYSHYETATNIIPTSFIFGLTKIYKPFSIDELFGRKKI